MQIGDFETAEAVVVQADRDATARNEPALAGGSRIVLQLIRLLSGSRGDWSDEARTTADAVIAMAGARGDEHTLARAHRLLAWVDGKACRYGDAATALGRAIEHARAAGTSGRSGGHRRRTHSPRRMGRRLSTRRSSDVPRSPSVSPATARPRPLSFASPPISRRCGASSTCARPLHQSRRLFEELGLRVEAASMVLESSRVELLAGNAAAAERELRRGFDVLEELRERYLLSTLAGLLAGALGAGPNLRGGGHDGTRRGDLRP